MSNISLTRVKRVAYFLKNDARFSTQKTVNVSKGRKEAVVDENSYKVAEVLANRGIDVSALNRKEVVGWAEHIILNQQAPKGAPEAKSSAKDIDDGEPDVKHAPLVDVPVRVAIYTLLLSALELSQYDKKPGGIEFHARLDQLTSDLGLSMAPKNAKVTVVDEDPDDDGDEDDKATVEAAPDEVALEETAKPGVPSLT